MLTTSTKIPITSHHHPIKDCQFQLVFMSFAYFQQRFSIMLANFSFSRVCKHTSQMFPPIPSILITLKIQHPENPQLFLSFSTVNFDRFGFASLQDFQQESLQTRFAAMYDQLQKSLRSDGLASRQKLRGSGKGGVEKCHENGKSEKKIKQKVGGHSTFGFFLLPPFSSSLGAKL